MGLNLAGPLDSYVVLSTQVVPLKKLWFQVKFHQTGFLITPKMLNVFY